jgi:hypothetical protein
MSAAEPIITGSCRCRKVLYDTTAPPMSNSHNYCYCETCRRVSGSAFLPFADFKAEDVFFREGAGDPTTTFHIAEAAKGIPAFKTYQATQHAERFFCGECGSQLGMRYFADPSFLGLTLGSMDQESLQKVEDSGEGLSVPKHIYLSEKVKWFEVPNDGGERQQTMKQADKLLPQK